MTFERGRCGGFEHSFLGIDWITLLQVKNKHVGQVRGSQWNWDLFKDILQIWLILAWVLESPLREFSIGESPPTWDRGTRNYRAHIWSSPSSAAWCEKPWRRAYPAPSWAGRTPTQLTRPSSFENSKERREKSCWTSQSEANSWTSQLGDDHSLNVG